MVRREETTGFIAPGMAVCAEWLLGGEFVAVDVEEG